MLNKVSKKGYEKGSFVIFALPNLKNKKGRRKIQKVGFRLVELSGEM